MNRPHTATLAVALIAASTLAGCALHRAPQAEGTDEAVAAPVEVNRPENPEPRPAEPAEAPAPRLLADEGLSKDLILATLLRTRELLESLGDRPLEPEQQRQVEIGARFLQEADDALERGDLGRAEVLSEKALFLIEDIAGVD